MNITIDLGHTVASKVRFNLRFITVACLNITRRFVELFWVSRTDHTRHRPGKNQHRTMSVVCAACTKFFRDNKNCVTCNMVSLN